MATALTPELALAYVRELSADVRAGVVLGANGAVLAGDAGLAELLAPPGGAAARPSEPGVFAERSDRHAVAVRCGPHAIEALVRRDLRAALASLDSAV